MLKRRAQPDASDARSGGHRAATSNVVRGSRMQLGQPRRWAYSSTIPHPLSASVKACPARALGVPKLRKNAGQACAGTLTWSISVSRKTHIDSLHVPYPRYAPRHGHDPRRRTPPFAATAPSAANAELAPAQNPRERNQRLGRYGRETSATTTDTPAKPSAESATFAAAGAFPQAQHAFTTGENTLATGKSQRGPS